MAKAGKPKNSGNLSPASKVYLRRVSEITGYPLDVVAQIAVAFPLAAAQLLLETGSVRTGTCTIQLRVPEKTIGLHYGPWIDVFPHRDILEILRDDPQNLLDTHHLELLQQYRRDVDAVRIPNPNGHHLRPRKKKEVTDGTLQVD